MEEKVKAPEVPEGCESIWAVFWELFSGERLSYSEIHAYSMLTDTGFTYETISLLRDMDSAGCSAMNKIVMKKNKPTPTHGKGK